MGEREEIAAELSADDVLLHRYITRKRRPVIPRGKRRIAMSKMKETFSELGIKTEKAEESVAELDRKRKERLAKTRPRWGAKYNRLNFGTGATAITAPNDIQAIARSQKRARSRFEKALSKDGRYRAQKSLTQIKGLVAKGCGTVKATKKANMLMKHAMKALNKKGRIHESDRHYYTKR